MKFFQLIFDGIISIADANVENRAYSYPEAGGFERDRKRLTGDVVRFGGDMRKVINRSEYGSQQSHKRTGSK